MYEKGTKEYLDYLKNETPGQSKKVDSFIMKDQEMKKENSKKHFSQVFQNPLKGFPYNEEFEVEAIEEGAFYGRDDLVKQFKTSKSQRKQNVRLVRDTKGGYERATLNIKKDKKKIAQMKKDGYKVDPTYYTEEVEAIDENKEALKNKAEKTGMPLGILKKVFDRGVAAWRTGHRPGTTPAQWGLARVNSFTTKSKGTWGGADKDLAQKVSGSKSEETVDEIFGFGKKKPKPFSQMTDREKELEKVKKKHQLKKKSQQQKKFKKPSAMYDPSRGY